MSAALSRLILCGWCNKPYDAGREVNPHSTGMCDACFNRFYPLEEAK